MSIPLGHATLGLDHAKAGGVVKAVLEGLAPGGVFGLFVVAFLQGLEFCPVVCSGW